MSTGFDPYSYKVFEQVVTNGSQEQRMAYAGMILAENSLMPHLHDVPPSLTPGLLAHVPDEDPDLGYAISAGRPVTDEMTGRVKSELFYAVVDRMERRVTSLKTLIYAADLALLAPEGPELESQDFVEGWSGNEKIENVNWEMIATILYRYITGQETSDQITLLALRDETLEVLAAEAIDPDAAEELLSPDVDPKNIEPAFFRFCERLIMRHGDEDQLGLYYDDPDEGTKYWFNVIRKSTGSNEPIYSVIVGTHPKNEAGKMILNFDSHHDGIKASPNAPETPGGEEIESSAILNAITFLTLIMLRSEKVAQQKLPEFMTTSEPSDS